MAVIAAQLAQGPCALVREVETALRDVPDAASDGPRFARAVHLGTPPPACLTAAAITMLLATAAYPAVSFVARRACRLRAVAPSRRPQTEDEHRGRRPNQGSTSSGRSIAATPGTTLAAICRPIFERLVSRTERPAQGFGAWALREIAVITRRQRYIFVSVSTRMLDPRRTSAGSVSALSDRHGGSDDVSTRADSKPKRSPRRRSPIETIAFRKSRFIRAILEILYFLWADGLALALVRAGAEAFVSICATMRGTRAALGGPCGSRVEVADLGAT